MNHGDSSNLIIEVFDADKIGKDKSLGQVEITPRDFDSHEPKWFPLKGVKSGEILLNTDILPPGTLPPGFLGDAQGHPTKDGSQPKTDDALAGKHERPSTTG